MSFAEGKWGCVMFLAANAARGKTAVAGRNNFGCWGGGVGLGFGNCYQEFPGGEECFLRFLSSGNKDWEKGRAVGEMLKEKAGRDFADQFLEGEGYVKDPELVREYLYSLPLTDVSPKSVVFTPLAEIRPEKPESVIFFVDADQLGPGSAGQLQPDGPRKRASLGGGLSEHRHSALCGGPLRTSAPLSG